ncbi:MAG: hypothetical protein ACMUEL_06355 [Flavobacteriales bacterium Tduv]
MDRERNKKNISKSQRIKEQPAYSGKWLFKMMLLSNWYDISDLETKELVK